MSRRILLAEDDPEMRRMLSEALQEDGYEVISADSGTQLLDFLEYFWASVLRGRFFDVDMVISDIRMPGVDGLNVLSELRMLDRSTPVVLITAFGDEQTHEKASMLGASAVFDKPFDLDSFRSYVRQVLPPGESDGSEGFE
jgi:CheY-like chemotaxis protein